MIFLGNFTASFRNDNFSGESFAFILFGFDKRQIRDEALVVRQLLKAHGRSRVRLSDAEQLFLRARQRGKERVGRLTAAVASHRESHLARLEDVRALLDKV